MTDAALSYSVPSMSCGHCRAAILAEVEPLAGVRTVDVDLDAKLVTVSGEALDDAAIRAAIDEAGYDVEDTP
jgi:copper chaperone CopZ